MKSDQAAAMSGLAMDHQSSSSGRSTPSDLPHNKLFVGGLSWQTSADKLREYFGQYGTIIDVQVLKDPLTQGGYYIDAFPIVFVVVYTIKEHKKY